MNILQEYWNKQKIAGLDGIFYNTGEVKSVYIESARNIQAVTSFGKVYKLVLEGETELNNLIEKYSNDIWSSFDILGELKLDNGNRFVYGEGEMGNEGFIVKLDSQGQILWSFYSTTSNPFINSCMLDHGIIGFLSSFNFILTLRENEDGLPQISILNPNIDNVFYPNIG